MTALVSRGGIELSKKLMIYSLFYGFKIIKYQQLLQKFIWQNLLLEVKA